jgi:hypothetical protein
LQGLLRLAHVVQLLGLAYSLAGDSRPLAAPLMQQQEQRVRGALLEALEEAEQASLADLPALARCKASAADPQQQEQQLRALVDGLFGSLHVALQARGRLRDFGRLLQESGGGAGPGGVEPLLKQLAVKIQVRARRRRGSCVCTRRPAPAPQPRCAGAGRRAGLDPCVTFSGPSGMRLLPPPVRPSPCREGAEEGAASHSACMLPPPCTLRCCPPAAPAPRASDPPPPRLPPRCTASSGTCSRRGSGRAWCRVSCRA